MDAGDPPRNPGVYFLLASDRTLLYVGKASNALSRERIEPLLRKEVRASIGDFRIDDSPDPTSGVLGRRDSRTQAIAAA